MKNRLAAFFAFIFILTICIPCASIAQSAKHNLVNSTVMLYIMPFPEVKNKDGSIGFATCTAVAFSKNKKKYLFFTTAHCVADYVEATSETVLSKALLYIAVEKSNGEQSLYSSEVLAIGEMKNFEDFAVLEAEINEDLSIIPLSESRPELDEDLRIVTAPVGSDLGFLQIRAYVSKEKANNVKLHNVKIEGAFVAQVIGLGSGRGSSGSGVFSPKRGEIVGIVIAVMTNSNGHSTFVISPISRFNDFYKEYTEGKRPLAKKEQVKPKK